MLWERTTYGPLLDKLHAAATIIEKVEGSLWVADERRALNQDMYLAGKRMVLLQVLQQPIENWLFENLSFPAGDSYNRPT